LQKCCSTEMARSSTIPLCSRVPTVLSGNPIR
jgi:hypothetical protein